MKTISDFNRFCEEKQRKRFNLNDQNHPFWDWASENYIKVIVVLGNHEFLINFENFGKNDQINFEETEKTIIRRYPSPA
jgi:hypothetical protein